MKSFLPVFLLLFLTACNSEENTNPGNNNISAPPAPKPLGYSIIKTFPHDTSSYTQGLLIYKGDLYEGTGNYGFSHIMKVDLATGKAIKKVPLDAKYFGEGVTILRDTVYQLTYKEGVAFAYTLPDFKKVKEFPVSTQGWGLTNNGSELIATDGSSNLYYYDPSTFQLLKTQTVTEGGTLSFNLNELEFIDGYIYANQYQQPYIVKIDPSNGQIVGKADLKAVWDRVKVIDPDADVPNGIAYDSATKKIYVTGKWWPELYEIEFSQ